MERILYGPMGAELWIEQLPGCEHLQNPPLLGFPCEEKSVFFVSEAALFLLLHSCSFFFIRAWEREQKDMHMRNLTAFSLAGDLGQYFVPGSAPQLSSVLQRLTTVFTSLRDKPTVVRCCSQMERVRVCVHTHT